MSPMEALSAVMGPAKDVMTRNSKRWCHGSSLWSGIFLAWSVSFAPTAHGADSPYNVLVYVLDATRADHMGFHGYPRDTTPFLDQLADEGVHWTSAHGASSWTWPSVASMLTGLTVETHGVYERSLALHPGWTNLPVVLAEEGYSTSMLTSNPMLSWEARTGVLFQNHRATTRPDQNLTDRLLNQLRSGPRPFFIYAQPYAAHTPYECPSPFDSLFVDDEYFGGLGDVPQINGNASCRGGMKELAVIGGETSMDWYVSQYDGLIAYMDDQIRQVFDELEVQGLRDSTLVIITADHGEELAGEHDLYFCHTDHYEGNLQIPLLVMLPEAFQREHGPFRGLALDGKPGHVDLMPTILGLLGVPIPEEVQGRNLAALPEPSGQVGFDHGGRTLRRGPFKVISRAIDLVPDPSRELYDLSVDPAEENDLSLTVPGMAAGMEARLLSIGAAAATVRPDFEPTGILYESDFENPEDTDGHIVMTGASLGRGWRFEEIDPDSNRVLHGWSNPSLGQETTYSTEVSWIGPPLTWQSVDTRIKLVSGTVVLQACWTSWLGQGYRLGITGNRLALSRHERGGRSQRWEDVEFDFGFDRWRDVRLECDGTFVKAFVDGEEVLVGREDDPGSIRGTVTLGLASTGGEAYVDGLRVERSDLSEAAAGVSMIR